MGVTSDEDIEFDSLEGGGDQISLTVGTSAVEGKVGVSVRSGRRYVIFQAKDQGVYFGYGNTVTTSDGIEIFKNQILMIPVGESTTIYFIATGAGKDVRFQELS